ncbi:hypothetical protein NMY22_g19757 [Coprinellus aureogranulatus]|nr:hypothetical protein NMY22_g19757 [Coprinellus aureogranulatus]
MAEKVVSAHQDVRRELAWAALSTRNFTPETSWELVLAMPLADMFLHMAPYIALYQQPQRDLRIDMPAIHAHHNDIYMRTTECEHPNQFQLKEGGVIDLTVDKSCLVRVRGAQAVWRRFELVFDLALACIPTVLQNVAASLSLYPIDSIPAKFKAHVSPAEYEVTVRRVSFDSKEAQCLVDFLSYFVYQAKEEKRYHEFVAAACSRFFGLFPEPYEKNLPARVAMAKEKIRTQFRSSYYHKRQVVPGIHWENFLSLPPQDMFEIGFAITDQANKMRAVALRREPTLRKDAGKLADQLTGRRKRVEHASVEIPVNTRNPELGAMVVVDATANEAPADDQEGGSYVQIVYDLTLSDEDLDDPDYVDEEGVDEEDDMFLP